MIDKPNIVWVMAEDMGLDLECYGMQGVTTPVLNRMAEEGIRFDNCYCTNPICSPSRSAMMVGAHQESFGAHNHRSRRDDPLEAPYRPITALLRDAGYTCVLGHEAVQFRGRKTDVNFRHEKVGDVYDGVENFGLFDKWDNAERKDAPFFHQIQLNVTHRGDWWESVRAHSPKPVRTDEIELPPYIADTAETRLDWAAYLDTVERMDYEMGLILNELRSKGLEKDTIVIFIADNGRCQIRGKGYLYESGLHIPMIVWGPGLVAPQSPEKRIVSTLDIVASVLDLAGAQMPSYLEGVPIINREFKGRSHIYGARDRWDEIDECMRSVCDGRYNYIRNYMPETPWDAHQAYLDFYRPVLHVMRRLNADAALNSRTSVFFQDGKPEEELYDWQADPHELQNLSADPKLRTVLEQMRGRMREYQRMHRDAGLEDLGHRWIDTSGAPEVRAWIRENHPELWEEITHQVFVKYGAIRDQYEAALERG